MVKGICEKLLAISFVKMSSSLISFILLQISLIVFFVMPQLKLSPVFNSTMASSLQTVGPDPKTPFVADNTYSDIFTIFSMIWMSLQNLLTSADIQVPTTADNFYSNNGNIIFLLVILSVSYLLFSVKQKYRLLRLRPPYKLFKK